MLNYLENNRDTHQSHTQEAGIEWDLMQSLISEQQEWAARVKFAPNACSMPPVNIYESESEFSLDVALPGFRSEDIMVELSERDVRISATKTFPTNPKVPSQITNYICDEYKREISFPTVLEIKETKIQFRDGLLMLCIPKREYADIKSIRIEFKN